MPIKTEAIGKTYAPLLYAVGREKIREFAAAVGETNPLHLDVETARAAGYDDVVAPPMFAVVYAGPSQTPALFDPEVGIVFGFYVFETTSRDRGGDTVCTGVWTYIVRGAE